MGQFNNGYRRPDFSGSKDFYSAPNPSSSSELIEDRKNKKKIFIIATIIALLTMIIGIVIYTINNSSNTKQDEIDLKEISSSLNLYTNYILYGEESNRDVDTLLKDGQITFIEECIYMKQDQRPLEKIKELYENYLKLYVQAKNIDDAYYYAVMYYETKLDEFIDTAASYSYTEDDELEEFDKLMENVDYLTEQCSTLKEAMESINEKKE